MGIETLFRKKPENAAKGLLGRKLVRTFQNKAIIEGRILEVSAWQGTSGDHIVYKFPDYPIGTLSVSCRYGKYLADITVGNGNSCITLVAAEIDLDGTKFKVQGPGNLSEALRIEPDFDGYDIIKGKELRIIGQPVDKSLVRKRNLSNAPNNCVGFYYIR